MKNFMGDNDSFLAVYNKVLNSRTKAIKNRKMQKQENHNDSNIQVGLNGLEIELEVPKTLRTEYNFIKFPFFDLAKDSKREEIKIEETVKTKEGEMHVLWWVTRDIKSRFPGDFEKRLHRAIEQIINATPKPVGNPLRVGSLRFVAKLMGINPESGKNRADIQHAFENLVTASIKAHGTFQLKENNTKRFLKDTFHLYDRVVYKGEELPNRKIADCIYLMLGSWYLHNVNNNYVIPIDWHFYNRLKGTRTTRMYEFLSIYFFVALENDWKYYDMRYSKVSDYFPLVRYHNYGEARKQLKPSHDFLIKSKYLSHVEWLDTQEKNDWTLRYWIGSRARAEYQHNKSEIRPSLLIPERRRPRKLAKIDENPPESPYLVKELNSRGVSQKAAEKLCNSHSEPYIEHKIEVFDFLIESGSELVARSPGGFLRNSIIDNYTDPPGFISKDEREKKKQEAIERKRRQDWQDRVERYKSWVESKPDDQVHWPLYKWEKEYKENNDHPPSPDEIKAKKQELIKALPSDHEKQIEIFGRIVFEENTGDLFDKQVISKEDDGNNPELKKP